ncbi:hypothetical protein [Xanthomonas citri]|uniref:hypothetical protein n=1 Tax=Xanthomonas citri TaxID=346 RepID=UPI001F2B103F|nr:hypothetical protein [Xanthomonas citri]
MALGFGMAAPNCVRSAGHSRVVWPEVRKKSAATTALIADLSKQASWIRSAPLRRPSRTERSHAPLQKLAGPLDTALGLLWPQAQGELARAMEEGMGVPVPLSPDVGRLRDALQQLRGQVAAQAVSIATIDDALGRLADLPVAVEGEGRAVIAELSAQLNALGAALRQKEGLQQWQQGRP